MVGLPETDGQGKILSDAWDYKGRPAVRSQSGGWASAAMILDVSANTLSVFTAPYVQNILYYQTRPI
ncbi:Protein NRT1/ PTR FAMILY 6.3 [Ananas comosus]|uniref:Protein NRT1/ PTR FAMILY 6.3 n=1 Tax=Ananas comosus TaxID=4615 RepID=A0A199V3I4_ANACO|nr:Protein NRT1/ PTR FAMILY 6.3 [Ananas comosus]